VPPLPQYLLAFRCSTHRTGRIVGGAVAGSPQEWRSAENVQEPDERDYYEAIRANLALNPDEERSLRILAWWRSNDAFRDADIISATTPRNAPEWEENLRALLIFLDESSEDNLVMKAEVCRELRMWAEAEAILGRVQSADLSPVVSQIRKLCESQDAVVREVERESPKIAERFSGPIFLEHPLVLPVLPD
jgi:hypothetical protein